MVPNTLHINAANLIKPEHTYLIGKTDLNVSQFLML